MGSRRALAWGIGTALAGGLAGSCPAQAQHFPVHTIYNTPPPAVMRVAIRAFDNPYGSILWVQTVGFQEYCSDVLPNEWMPSWDPASLRAGAMAVRMFAWYHHLHPVTVGGFTFDVDNTANFQVFRYQSGTPATDQAVRAVWPYAYALPDGGIAPLDYRAGWRNTANWPLARSQKVSQWGSAYLAQSGRSHLQILHFYAPGRVWQRVP